MKEIIEYFEKIKENFNIETYKISYLNQGEYNINYLVETESNKLVLRINSKSQMNLKNQIKYEYDTLKFLEKSKVTPKVFYYDDSNTSPLNGSLIMEYLDGRTLNYNTDLEKASYIFSKIHRLDVKNQIDKFILEENLLENRIQETNYWLKEVFESEIISKDQKNFFYNFLNYLEKHKGMQKYFDENKILCLNNTEVNSGNFIIGEKPYLIDWEKAVISDPCQDITHFIIETTTRWKTDFIATEEYKKHFYNNYEKNLGEKIEIKERVDIYTPFLLSRALSWCLNAYIQYNKENKLIKNEETYRKIKEFTDIYYMKKLLKKYF